MSGTFSIHLDRTDGEHNPRAKLSRKQADHILASWARKPAMMTQLEFFDDWAALFGVSRSCIRHVCRGEHWRRIPA